MSERVRQICWEERLLWIVGRSTRGIRAKIGRYDGSPQRFFEVFIPYEKMSDKVAEEARVGEFLNGVVNADAKTVRELNLRDVKLPSRIPEPSGKVDEVAVEGMFRSDRLTMDDINRTNWKR